jgi:hypothetical protein
MAYNRFMITAETRKEAYFALALALAGAAARVLPHPANFAPVAALALFSGVTMPRRLALTVPLFAMIASDVIIGPHDLAAFTWGSFATIAFLGGFLRTKARPGTLCLGTVAGSVFFFLVTNFGVFLFGGLYPRTAEGLVRCYALALPFFRNTFLGDLFFSAVLFGAFAAVKARAPKPLPYRSA